MYPKVKRANWARIRRHNKQTLSIFAFSVQLIVTRGRCPTLSATTRNAKKNIDFHLTAFFAFCGQDNINSRWSKLKNKFVHLQNSRFLKFRSGVRALVTLRNGRKIERFLIQNLARPHMSRNSVYALVTFHVEQDKIYHDDRSAITRYLDLITSVLFLEIGDIFFFNLVAS